MKVSDLIVYILEQWKFKHCFMVTGGGAMHLNDSIGRSNKISVVPLHHEQSCSMAADSYFRAINEPAIINVTTGPGAINALTGVYGAYVDSVPMIVISGQVRSDHLISAIDDKLRQFGDQEANIISMVEAITKNSILLKSKQNIVDKLNKIIFSSIDGRKGPVWIDVPLDIQASTVKISKKEVKALTKTWIEKSMCPPKPKVKTIHKVDQMMSMIRDAKRPIIIAGNGVRFSGNISNFNKFIELLRIPVCTVWNSHDLVTNDNLLYAGRPGADGERAGNFNMQNCDLLIILGARMHVRQVGFNSDSFCRQAKKIMVDIDKSELSKPNLAVDLKIHEDLGAFFDVFFEKANRKKLYNPEHKKYLKWCRKNVKELKVVTEKHLKSEKNTINSYHFMKELFNSIDKKTDVVTGDGTASVVTYKVANLKKGQRLYTNKGCAAMGYDLPALIGSLYASPSKSKILIAGDGSIMMNLQELSSLKPFRDNNIKIFLINNSGYHSIRQSQKNYFKGYEVGCGEESNLYFPSFKEIARTFKLEYQKIRNIDDFHKVFRLNTKGIKLIEVFVDKNQEFEPRPASKKLPDGTMVSSPLEEMSPLLDKKSFMERMLIPLAKNSNYEE